jgi:trigger factor
MKKKQLMSELEKSVVIEIPKDSLDEKIESKLISIGKKAKIKGFRPGKIPNSVLKKYHGSEAYQDAISDLIQVGYAETIKESNHDPISPPNIKPIENNGDNLRFEATFEILPDIELKGLDKISINRPDVKITSKDIDNMLEKLRKQKRTWKKIDTKSIEGNQINIDFIGNLNGEIFEGGEGKAVNVVLGEKQMIPEFEKALYGLKTGDKKSFKVKFPNDYHSKELSGKKVDFDLTVNSLEEEVLPDIDKAFVKEFGIDNGDIKKLREDVTRNMKRELSHKINQDVKNQVMQGLLEKNDFPVPVSMKDNEIKNMQKESMRQMNIKDEKDMPPAENFTAMAEKRVQLGLLISKYIEDKALKVDQEKVKKHIDDMFAGYQEPDKLIEQYMGNQQIMGQIQSMVLEEQAFDLIAKEGKEKSNKISFSEYMNH